MSNRGDIRVGVADSRIAIVNGTPDEIRQRYTGGCRLGVESLFLFLRQGDLCPDHDVILHQLDARCRGGTGQPPGEGSDTVYELRGFEHVEVDVEQPQVQRHRVQRIRTGRQQAVARTG